MNSRKYTVSSKPSSRAMLGNVWPSRRSGIKDSIPSTPSTSGRTVCRVQTADIVGVFGVGLVNSQQRRQLVSKPPFKASISDHGTMTHHSNDEVHITGARNLRTINRNYIRTDIFNVIHSTGSISHIYISVCVWNIVPVAMETPPATHV